VALLEVDDLRTTFKTEDGIVAAVNGLSFSVEPGSTLGIVGESGSGKSVTSLSIMRLIAQNGRIEHGTIRFKGENLLEKSEAEMRKIRGRDIAMIFQDPMTSLNPVLTIGEQIAEATRLHLGLNPKKKRSTRPSICCAWSASRRPRSGIATIRTSSRAGCASE
jgi:ABC-type dipeptide/oligopeptide/nickel transport system ATPase component